MSLLRLVALALAFAVAVPPVLVALSERVEAQERRTLFDLLFGRDKEEEPQAQPPRQQGERSRPAPRRETRRAPQSPPPPEVEAKIENARVVLVVGDFVGGGLAQGLKRAYADSPGVRIVERTSGSSGLVRDDHYDWPANIGDILETEEPDIVIVQIGSNDRQDIVIDGQSEKPRSEPWLEEYTARARAISAAVRERDIPLIWVGLPSFRFSSMTADMLAFNDIYRVVAEDAGGEFVDIWEGFVDENGKFVQNGPDINGQTVQLRASDGINITSAGKRKMAFYVEKPLNRLLGDAISPEIEELDPYIPPEMAAEPEDVADIERTVPISFTDPELDGGIELMGAEVVPKPAEGRNPAEKLAIEGVAPPPPPGRADHFSTRKPEAVTPAAEAPTTTAIGPR